MPDAFGSLSPGDPAASAMTHWPSASPDEDEKYLIALRNLRGIGGGISDFTRGGLLQVLRGQGIQLPDWINQTSDILQSPEFNAALGVATPIKTPIWSAEKITRLRELKAQGKSYSKIADEIGDGATKGSIAGKMKRLGENQPMEEAPGSEYFWSDDDAERFRGLLAQGKSWREAGNEIGVSRRAAINKGRAMGISPAAPFPEELNPATVQKLWWGGMGKKELAQKFGISLDEVNQHLKSPALRSAAPEIDAKELAEYEKIFGSLAPK
jgi:hypothetical protein